MHPLKGRKQSAEHIAKRAAAMRGKKGYRGGGKPLNSPDVLWSKVEINGPDECWPWKGFKNKQGYGRTWIKDKGYYAHRVIFNLASHGTISLSAPSVGEAGFLMHICDNPPCCNPAHLRVCTHAENMADSKIKGRTKWEHSTKSPRAKLTEEDVRWIRLNHERGAATIRAQALLYGVSRSVISHLLYGRSYQDIT